MSCHPLYTVYNTDIINSIVSAWEHGQAYNTESSHLSLHFFCNDIYVLMFCVFHFASFILWKSLQLTKISGKHYMCWSSKDYDMRCWNWSGNFVMENSGPTKEKSLTGVITCYYCFLFFFFFSLLFVVHICCTCE